MNNETVHHPLVQAAIDAKKPWQIIIVRPWALLNAEQQSVLSELIEKRQRGEKLSQDEWEAYYDLILRRDWEDPWSSI
jgi:hypothetical protein